MTCGCDLMLFNLFQKLVIATLMLIVAITAYASGGMPQSLSEALQAALEKTGKPRGESANYRYEPSTWLAELPSIYVSYLDSQESRGTDEAELSLNLPIKSGGQRKADKHLKETEQHYSLADSQQRSLFFSGLIRHAVWSHRIAATHLEFEENKLRLLTRLEQQYQDLVAYSEASEYGLLVIQQELFNTDVARLEYQQATRQWLEQYTQITGLNALPWNIAEVTAELPAFSVQNHPKVQMLEQDWQQQQLVMKSTSNQFAPWNVSLSVKDFSGPDLDEQQIGIAVEVPLGFAGGKSQSEKSQWIQARKDFDIARDALYMSLHEQWNSLFASSRVLKQKQKVLLRSVALSERIIKQADELKAQNEIEQEVIIRRMMNALDAQLNYALNQVFINQNQAMLRQAAGISL